MEKQYYVYITSNKNNSVLYIGVTSNLIKRIWEHKNKPVDGFTKKYNVDKLVYFEITSDINSALQREKQLKKWNRSWKDEIIDEYNNERKDLYFNLIK
ncbi:MAG: GIY-YIG nuclease family protein [Patescibacteria group bacterium]